MRGLLLLALLLFACRSESISPRPVDPSILLITVDTLRPDALGWVGGRNATPVIDRIAREGFRFPAAVSPVPLTFPSHAAIMTGVLPRRMGLRDNGQTLGAHPLVLAEILRARGYTTAAFVSGYPLSHEFGLDRGFDHYDDRFSSGEGEWLERRALETTAAARTWLASARTPWFLWVHYYDPHFPYEGSYGAEVALADRAIGELLAAVPQSILTIFAADHGESLGEHGEGTHGFFIYDSTVLVPLVFRYPGVISPGESRRPARLIDLMPTVLDLLDAPKLLDADGESLLPTIRGQPQEIDAAYIETYQPWLSYGWAPLSAVRDGGSKLIAAPRPEWYDLTRDPHEQQNIYDTDRARKLAILHRNIRNLMPIASAEQNADPESIAKLRALGYIGAGAAADEPPAEGLRDPKDAAELREVLTEADRLLRIGNQRAAILKFDEVLKRDPDNRFALLRSGIALMSIPRLQKFVAAVPDQPEARSALARALLREGRATDAVPHAMEAARLQPRRAAVWAELGSALGVAKRIPEAVGAFERAVDLAPDDPKLIARLAFAEHAAGRIPDAAKHLEQTAAMEGDRFAHAGALGILLFDLGRHDEARKWLARSRPSEPEYAEARRRLK